MLAGLSLPAIVSLATATTPGKPWREVALSFLIAATGLFFAGFQITIGSVYARLYHWGKFRAGLTVVGIIFLVVTLIVLILGVAGHSWAAIAMAVLVLGGLTQPLARIWLRCSREVGWRGWLAGLESAYVIR